jgi:hypothetical protein
VERRRIGEIEGSSLQHGGDELAAGEKHEEEGGKLWLRENGELRGKWRRINGRFCRKGGIGSRRRGRGRERVSGGGGDVELEEKGGDLLEFDETKMQLAPVGSEESVQKRRDVVGCEMRWRGAAGDGMYGGQSRRDRAIGRRGRRKSRR